MTTPATEEFKRFDGRTPNQMREVTIERNYLQVGEGSVLVSFGATKVLCQASFTQGVPRWRKGSGLGWVTAEYAMLPRATDERSSRESVRGKIGGRTHEISRLIGRALRSIVDLSALGENTIVLDCDVLQADGGTRTAAITGAFVALADAMLWGKDEGHIPGKALPLSDTVAAVSSGMLKERALLDLPYVEDVAADTDMNVVATGSGNLVEVQGTAEGVPFNRRELDEMIDLALSGIEDLTRLQREALGERGTEIVRPRI